MANPQANAVPLDATANAQYRIDFAGLKAGEHTYAFAIGNDFFAARPYSPIQSGDVVVETVMQRQEHTLELNFTLDGTVDLPCDRCLTPLHVPLQTDTTLLVKLVETPTPTEDDDVLMLSRNEHIIDLADYLYQVIVTAVPLQNSCADVKPEGCPPEAEALLKRYSDAANAPDADPTAMSAPTEDAPNNEPLAPKSGSPWDALKNLRFD